LRATSPTYGAVTVELVDGPGQDRFYLLCVEKMGSDGCARGRTRTGSLLSSVCGEDVERSAAHPAVAARRH